MVEEVEAAEKKVADAGSILRVEQASLLAGE